MEKIERERLYHKYFNIARHHNIFKYLYEIERAMRNIPGGSGVFDTYFPSQHR